MLPFRRKVVATATKGGAANRQHFILAPTGAFIASAAILYNSPLNQPALWAEPIGQCVST